MGRGGASAGLRPSRPDRAVAAQRLGRRRCLRPRCCLTCARRPRAGAPAPEKAASDTPASVVPASGEPAAEAAAPGAPTPEKAVPDAAAPGPTVLPGTTGDESAGGGGTEGGGEVTLPGLNITVVPGQIGYPRDVVPGAELVKTVSSDEGTQLPHWADPPTGEVPRALAGAPGDDDLQGWRLLGSKGLRWREDMSDWSDGPGVEDLVDQDEGQANRMDAPG